MRSIQLLQSKSLLKRHPWVYSGATREETLKSGEIVHLMDGDTCLATAYADPGSKILFRVLEWKAVNINLSWWIEKLTSCWKRRESILRDNTAFRLIHGEGEGLPGLIIDYYDGWLCLQAQSEGLSAHIETIVKALEKVCQPKGVFERSDSAYRNRQGHSARSRWLLNEAPKEPIWVREGSVFYHVDLENGQKSGHYCDQRENRLIAAKYAQKARVLDLCCNSGGFSLQALKNGALSVVAVDSSTSALNQLEENLQKSCPESFENVHRIQGGIVEVLDHLESEGQLFDLIILDPPKLAPKRSDMASAMRAYKDFNRRALKCLAPFGKLVTFSCSSVIERQDLLTAISWAALDADRHLIKLEDLCQPKDHPVSLYCPESEYLKGFVLEALN